MTKRYAMLTDEPFIPQEMNPFCLFRGRPSVYVCLYDNRLTPDIVATYQSWLEDNVLYDKDKVFNPCNTTCLTWKLTASAWRDLQITAGPHAICSKPRSLLGCKVETVDSVITVGRLWDYLDAYMAPISLWPGIKTLIRVPQRDEE